MYLTCRNFVVCSFVWSRRSEAVDFPIASLILLHSGRNGLMLKAISSSAIGIDDPDTSKQRPGRPGSGSRSDSQEMERASLALTHHGLGASQISAFHLIASRQVGRDVPSCPPGPFLGSDENCKVCVELFRDRSMPIGQLSTESQNCQNPMFPSELGGVTLDSTPLPLCTRQHENNSPTCCQFSRYTVVLIVVSFDSAAVGTMILCIINMHR